MVFLGGYPAKRCPRAVHNRFSPTSPDPEPFSAQTQTLFDAGNSFEDDVTDLLREALGDRGMFLTEQGPESWEANVKATLAAIGRGDDVIVNGRLPPVGSRVGAPDVLVRVGDRSGPTYLPIDIKNHKSLRARTAGKLTYSALDAPAERLVVDGFSNRGNHDGDDTLQLAHYIRMLGDLGVLPDGPAWGGVIGTDPYDDVTDYALGITWYDLTEPVVKTYSVTGEGRARCARHWNATTTSSTSVSGSRKLLPLGESSCDRSGRRSASHASGSTTVRRSPAPRTPASPSPTDGFAPASGISSPPVVSRRWQTSRDSPSPTT